MIFNILDNTTELYKTKYIIDEIFSSGGATLYKNPSDQTVSGIKSQNFVHFREAALFTLKKASFWEAREKVCKVKKKNQEGRYHA